VNNKRDSSGVCKQIGIVPPTGHEHQHNMSLVIEIMLNVYNSIRIGRYRLVTAVIPYPRRIQLKYNIKR